FREIGDIALKLEQESGVLGRETISFIGDIASVAREAGYELEEFMAIAAVAQQRSGRSGAAIAEAFGRVLPSLAEQKDKLMELAATERALGTPEFIDAIRQSDIKVILDQIGAAYNDMSTQAQQLVVHLLGGRREAQSISPAIANQAQIKELEKAAEQAGGTLESRFEDLKETLTTSLQRFGEVVRQLGVYILEAGITDAFENALEIAKVFLTVLGGVARVVSAINDLF